MSWRGPLQPGFTAALGSWWWLSAVWWKNWFTQCFTAAPCTWWWLSALGRLQQGFTAALRSWWWWLSSLSWWLTCTARLRNSSYSWWWPSAPSWSHLVYKRLHSSSFSATVVYSKASQQFLALGDGSRPLPHSYRLRLGFAAVPRTGDGSRLFSGCGRLQQGFTAAFRSGWWLVALSWCRSSTTRLHSSS